ncbi:homologous-pairing protein-like protein 2 [Patellaria atrata CBS 101060]|uniref:Homologous-pairing protein-like protein 2 n=1 Tax=Patellaria atrata CBS 101060 TaxID=1346257 RepID=A0A9P4S3Y4_9PEZI|nr:homologous-pairing protein-like protein 2 [Patellaria atrata CBS 101060]
MAPRKEKGEKVSVDEGLLISDAIDRKQKYVEVPFGSKIVMLVQADQCRQIKSSVLSAATKILKDLHERKEIEGRAAGKQIVYHAVQNAKDSASPDDLAVMDATIVALRDETTNLRATEKSLKTSLSTLQATLSTTDLRAAVSTLETERTEILGRLEGLRSGSAKPIDEKEKQDVEDEVRKWESLERKRKKIREEMWGFLCESLPEELKAEDLKEQLGLDE